MNLSLSFYAISYSMKRLLALFVLALALGWAGIASAQVHTGPNARPRWASWACSVPDPCAVPEWSRPSPLNAMQAQSAQHSKRRLRLHRPGCPW